MIHFVAGMQALQCSDCEAWFEVPRKVMRDPDRLVDLIDRTKQKHQDVCKKKQQQHGS